MVLPVGQVDEWLPVGVLEHRHPVAEAFRRVGGRRPDRLAELDQRRALVLRCLGEVVVDSFHQRCQVRLSWQKCTAAGLSRRSLSSDRPKVDASSIMPARGASPSNMLTVQQASPDRKSTRLNSSHQIISYAVFCLKKKKH